MGGLLSTIDPTEMPTSVLQDPLYAEYMCDSDRECEEATGYPYEEAMRGDEADKYPRLVGIGCEGTVGAPIYAFEEDHFPECREIWPMDWDWQEKE